LIVRQELAALIPPMTQRERNGDERDAHEDSHGGELNKSVVRSISRRSLAIWKPIERNTTPFRRKTSSPRSRDRRGALGNP